LLREFSAMNASVASRARWSGRWFIGDFMRYELGPSSWPPIPLGVPDLEIVPPQTGPLTNVYAPTRAPPRVGSVTPSWLLHDMEVRR
jgi:hypothetical protein